MKNVKIIMKKELDRVFKNKKLIFSLFILPGLLMIVIYSLLGRLTDGISKNASEHISKVYVQNVPEDIKNFMSASGFDKMATVSYISAAQPETEAIKSAILDGSADLLVTFDENFSQAITSYKNAGDAIPTVHIFYNPTENYSSVAYQKFAAVVLTNYKTQVTANRLGDLDVLKVFSIDEQVIQNEEKAGREFLSMMLPYLITFLLFTSAMSLVMDSMAGEKERGTMARLLMTPVSRTEIAFGKMSALTILSMISSVCYAIALLISAPMMGETLGTTGPLSFSAGQIISLLVILIMLAYLYVVLISCVSIIAKDMKEAGTYTSPLYIVVVVAAMISMFTTQMEMPTAAYAIPVFGTALSIQNILINEITPLQLFLSIGGNLVAALVFTFLVGKAFDSEKKMFNA